MVHERRPVDAGAALAFSADPASVLLSPSKRYTVFPSGLYLNHSPCRPKSIMCTMSAISCEAEDTREKRVIRQRPRREIDLNAWAENRVPLSPDVNQPVQECRDPEEHQAIGPTRRAIETDVCADDGYGATWAGEQG